MLQDNYKGWRFQHRSRCKNNVNDCKFTYELLFYIVNRILLIFLLLSLSYSDRGDIISTQIVSTRDIDNNQIYIENLKEEFVENYEDNIKKIFQKLELNWENHLLDFHKNKRPVETSSFQQVRKKIYKNSSDEWKKYKSYLKPMMEVLSKNNIDF